jgi:hypothetical protein
MPFFFRHAASVRLARFLPRIVTEPGSGVIELPMAFTLCKACISEVELVFWRLNFHRDERW